MHSHFFTEIKRSQSIEQIDVELWACLTTAQSLHDAIEVLEATEIVMVDHLEATVVPDASLKSRTA